MPAQQPLDVAIIGGGIAGICLAIGLLKNENTKVTVYESAHKFGEIGAGVAFGPSAIRAMRGISPGIEAAMAKVGTGNGSDSHKHIYFDMRVGEGVRTGERFQQITMADGDQHLGVHRAHFVDEIVKLIPDGVAHFGKKVIEATQQADGSVNLKFKDGTNATHQAVVGCDGIHSQMRKYVLGPEDPACYPVFSGKYCHRGLAPMSEAIAAVGEEVAVNSTFWIGKHAHLLTFPVDKGKTFNAVAMGSCDSWDNEKWVVHSDFKDINDDFAAFGDSVQKIISLMRDTDIWALFNHLPAKTYYSGNAVIIGDAAHATTPHQGSGAGMAIEDAFVLSSLMKHVQSIGEVEQCFKAFDAVRRNRGNKLVETSREAGELWQMELPGVGDDLRKISQDVTTRWDWIWREDLDKEVEEGLEVFRA